MIPGSLGWGLEELLGIDLDSGIACRCHWTQSSEGKTGASLSWHGDGKLTFLPQAERGFNPGAEAPRQLSYT